MLKRAEPDDALRRLARLEEGDDRDAQDVEGLGKGRIGVHVHLDHIDAAVVLLGQLLHLGCDHLAGSTPGCPEVDHDGALRLEDEFLEIRVSRDLDLRHGIRSLSSR